MDAVERECIVLDSPGIDSLDVEYTRSHLSVDYDVHFAYRQYILDRTITNSVRSLAVFTISAIRVSLKRLVRYELIPLEYRRANRVATRFLFLIAAGRNLVFGRCSLSKALTTRGSSDKILNTLRTDGVCVLRMPAEQFSHLHSLCAPHISKLREIREQSSSSNRRFEDSRLPLDRSSATELFKCIENILDESGVLVAASQYLGRSVKLVDITPQVNDSSDNFWKDVYSDLGARIPATAYFHRDASGGDLKAIIYCEDVEADGGPFGYVLGSHKMKPSWFHDLICETNDHCELSSPKQQSRRAFGALPKLFRQKGAFGNDLLDNDILSKKIMLANWSICGSSGTVVLFDTKGIHRGGMVSSGERSVVTCVIG